MKKIEDYFVPYFIALELKELGFDEGCICYYRSMYPFEIVLLSDWRLGTRTVRNSGPLKLESYFGPAAPLYDQVIDWFFDNHGICISTPNLTFGWYKILSSEFSIEDKLDKECGYGRAFTRQEVLCRAFSLAIEVVKKSKKILKQNKKYSL